MIGVSGRETGSTLPFAVLSHRGDQLAFYGPGPNGDIFIRVFDPAEPAQVRDVLAVGSPQGPTTLRAWSADDRELIVSRTLTASGTPLESDVPFENVERLWAVDVETGTMRVLSEPIVNLGGVEVRPDGGQIAFSAGREFSELWALEDATAALGR